MPRESTLGGRDAATMPWKNARSSFVAAVVIRLGITRRAFSWRNRREVQSLQCVVLQLGYAKEIGLLMIARMSIKLAKLTRGAFGCANNFSQFPLKITCARSVNACRMSHKRASHLRALKKIATVAMEKT
jgi:hypothetical protein